MFKYFKKISRKKLLLWTALSYLVYFLITILGPVLIVLGKYGILNNTNNNEVSYPESKIRLSGWALALIIAIAIAALFALRRNIEKINDVRPAGAIFKYTLSTISNLIFPIIILVAVRAMKVNFDLAVSTIMDITWFYIAGALLEGTIINIISREHRLRDKAKEFKEQQDRLANC